MSKDQLYPTNQLTMSKDQWYPTNQLTMSKDQWYPTNQLTMSKGQWYHDYEILSSSTKPAHIRQQIMFQQIISTNQVTDDARQPIR
jgi:hypothetical protein